jgi:hypothetical protein
MYPRAVNTCDVICDTPGVQPAWVIVNERVSVPPFGHAPATHSIPKPEPAKSSVIVPPSLADVATGREPDGRLLVRSIRTLSPVASDPDELVNVSVTVKGVPLHHGSRDTDTPVKPMSSTDPGTSDLSHSSLLQGKSSKQQVHGGGSKHGSQSAIKFAHRSLKLPSHTARSSFKISTSASSSHRLDRSMSSLTTVSPQV